MSSCMNSQNSNGSYVRAVDIGGVMPQTVGDNWARYSFGVDTSFNFPTSFPGPSQLTNSSSFAASSQGQAWAAQQVLLEGWNCKAETLYNTLYSNNYPNAFISNRVLAPGTYVSSMGTTEFFNLGQIYLQNCFLYTFINWPFGNTLVDPINANGAVVPSGSLNHLHNSLSGLAPSIPEGLRCDTKKELLEGAASKKYGQMIVHAYQEIVSSPNGLGPLGNAIIYIINELDRQKINWVNTGFGELFKDWYNNIKTRYGQISNCSR